MERLVKKIITTTNHGGIIAELYDSRTSLAYCLERLMDWGLLWWTGEFKREEHPTGVS